jgi:hypothetical protein
MLIAHTASLNGATPLNAGEVDNFRANITKELDTYLKNNTLDADTIGIIRSKIAEWTGAGHGHMKPKTAQQIEKYFLTTIEAASSLGDKESGTDLRKQLIAAQDKLMDARKLAALKNLPSSNDLNISRIKEIEDKYPEPNLERNQCVFEVKVLEAKLLISHNRPIAAMKAFLSALSELFSKNKAQEQGAELFEIATAKACKTILEGQVKKAQDAPQTEQSYSTQDTSLGI